MKGGVEENSRSKKHRCIQMQVDKLWGGLEVYRQPFLTEMMSLFYCHYIVQSIFTL